jgi:glucoamylase
LLATDGAGFFAEEKRDWSFETTTLEDGVPAFQVVSIHLGGRFRITKRIVADPWHDVVLQQVQLEVLEGPKLRLFALLAPHLVSDGRTTPPGSATTRAAGAVRRGRRHGVGLMR